MSIAALEPPALDADPSTLVDWLEMRAFFDGRWRARLDEVDDAFDFQRQEAASDIADEDAEAEARREIIGNEIQLREDCLGDAYPFVLSDDGEELRLKPKGSRRGFSFYVSCLIISHFTRSPILALPPTGADARNVRKRQFQTLATLAVAGHVRGPAVSFGWPRPDGETIASALARCCAGAQTGAIRPIPSPEASASAKDGGMDVIAWRLADNGMPPPAMMYFCQAASGHNWRAKSAVDEKSQFLEGYFLDQPACSTVGLTVVPFRLTQDDHARFGRRHGHILDRLRTPIAALIAIDMAANENVAIDELDAVKGLFLWLVRYRKDHRVKI